MTLVAERIPGLSETEARERVLQPIAGDPVGRDLLSMRQLGIDDIHGYFADAQAAELIVRNPTLRGMSLTPHAVLKAVMRQPSTRTGGSMTTAMAKLGGIGDLISGMHASAEAKGESLTDSWVAFATQADIIGTRTKEEGGPTLAAAAIEQAFANGKLWQKVPVINLGDGTNEHPTQTLGDLFTIQQRLGRLEGLTAVVVGDQERYRAHHSFLLGAATVGMTVVAVESEVARVPHDIVDTLGNKLSTTSDLDEALRSADVLVMGRNPDEYDGEDEAEHERSRLLAEDYKSWIIDYDRLQQMRPNGVLLHPRPRRDELHPSIDIDPRAADVEQMAHMIPMRMAIIARHLGTSITAAVHR